MRRDIGEYNTAVMDLREDVIEEVNAGLPASATGAQALRAVRDRLDRGLPKLIEVDLYVGDEASS